MLFLIWSAVYTEQCTLEPQSFRTFNQSANWKLAYTRVCACERKIVETETSKKFSMRMGVYVCMYNNDLRIDIHTYIYEIVICK